MSAREKKLQTDDCTKLTHHLLIMLPKLLSKVIYVILMQSLTHQQFLEFNTDVFLNAVLQ